METKRGLRRSTRFGRWVKHYGVNRLSRDLAGRDLPTTPSAVYEWLAGRSAPRPERAVVIAQLSRGRVSFADLYQHREAVRGR